MIIDIYEITYAYVANYVGLKQLGLLFQLWLYLISKCQKEVSF